MIDQDLKDLIEKLVAEKLEAGKPVPVSSKDKDAQHVIGRAANGNGTVSAGGNYKKRKVPFHTQKAATIKGGFVGSPVTV